MSNAAKAHTFKIQYTTAKECAVFGKMVFSQEFETAEQLEAEMEMMAMAEGVTHWMAQFSDGTVIENGVVIDGITVVHTDNYSDQLGRFKHDNFGRVDFLSGSPDQVAKVAYSLGFMPLCVRSIASYPDDDRIEITGGNENNNLQKVGELEGVGFYRLDN